jgi:hypothetical protein
MRGTPATKMAGNNAQAVALGSTVFNSLNTRMNAHANICKTNRHN